MRHGAAEWIAAEVARAVGRAEATGNVICGLYYLESYCQQLRVRPGEGRRGAGREPAAPRRGSGRCALRLRPAGLCPGALPCALAAARDYGTATLAVGHAHTCTSLGYFTEQIAREGLIAIGFTNATPIVAPPGGKARVIGTNPIAFSVPDGPGGIAMQFDFSTSAVALGKITMAKAAGETIPLGWAVDAAGNPTTDPEAALSGALLSAGGHKGWGFGLMAELLAAGMTGGVNSLDVKPLKAPEGPPHDLGQFYMLIDPATSSDFAARFARLAEAIAEDEGARLPGARVTGQDMADVPEALWQGVLALGGVI